MGQSNETFHSAQEEITRREALKKILSLFGVAATLPFLGLLIKEVDDIKRQRLNLDQIPKNDTNLESQARWLKENYQINIELGLGLFENTKKNYRPLEDQAVTLNEKEAWLKIICQEIIKYPPDYFNSHQIKNIKIFHYANGGRGYYQPPGLLTKHHGFCLQANLPNRHISSPIKQKIMAGTFHHELYHVLDLNDPKYETHDQLWRDISDRLDKYCLHKNPAHSDQVANLASCEERANLAKYLMDPQVHYDLEEKMRFLADEQFRQFLQAKIDFIKDRFFTYSQGQLGNQYWRDLLAERVDPDYFN